MVFALGGFGIIGKDQQRQTWVGVKGNRTRGAQPEPWGENRSKHPGKKALIPRKRFPGNATEQGGKEDPE